MLKLQRCARINGVWDDSNNVWDGGGSCITQEEAAQKLLADPAGLEKLSLALSNDGKLATFTGASTVPTDIRWATAQSLLINSTYYDITMLAVYFEMHHWSRGVTVTLRVKLMPL